jgi:regulator of replication initiation timing
MTQQKFTLPDFDENDAEVWFDLCDAIFKNNKVEDKKKKFSYLLEKLDTKSAKTIRDIILTTDEEILNSSYTKAKKKLICALGDSQEQKLDKLISGADIPTDAKPSTVLQILQGLAGNLPCQDVIKRIWLSKLPKDIQLSLASIQTSSIQDLCTVADSMYGILSRQHFVSAVQQTSSTDSITAALNHLTAEVTALRFENKYIKEELKDIKLTQSRSRSRFRSPTPEKRHKFARGKSQTKLYQGMCWYHFTFGDDSKKCEGECKFRDQFQKSKSGNGN